ncbi:hypothetical protein IWQ60_005623 [Tieghemiomyces parasiticus]|uniref:Uncharacterized protein n=1 Tax=Tieghemiomyces parasiticus TaxID=78921 RepID=A0A9W8A8S4_9FUNG|nr:hypothetical protein IWQ60_005623 [Tieghemiomyces parasiticus]
MVSNRPPPRLIVVAITLATLALIQVSRASGTGSQLGPGISVFTQNPGSSVTITSSTLPLAFEHPRDNVVDTTSPLNSPADSESPWLSQGSAGSSDGDTSLEFNRMAARNLNADALVAEDNDDSVSTADSWEAGYSSADDESSESAKAQENILSSYDLARILQKADEMRFYQSAGENWADMVDDGGNDEQVTPTNAAAEPNAWLTGPPSTKKQSTAGQPAANQNPGVKELNSTWANIAGNGQSSSNTPLLSSQFNSNFPVLGASNSHLPAAPSARKSYAQAAGTQRRSITSTKAPLSRLNAQATEYRAKSAQESGSMVVPRTSAFSAGATEGSSKLPPTEFTEEDDDDSVEIVLYDDDEVEPTTILGMTKGSFKTAKASTDVSEGSTEPEAAPKVSSSPDNEPHTTSPKPKEQRDAANSRSFDTYRTTCNVFLDGQIKALKVLMTGSDSITHKIVAAEQVFQVLLDSLEAEYTSALDAGRKELLWLSQIAPEAVKLIQRLVLPTMSRSNRRSPADDWASTVQSLSGPQFLYAYSKVDASLMATWRTREAYTLQYETFIRLLDIHNTYFEYLALQSLKLDGPVLGLELANLSRSVSHLIEFKVKRARHAYDTMVTHSIFDDLRVALVETSVASTNSRLPEPQSRVQPDGHPDGEHRGQGRYQAGAQRPIKNSHR